MNDMRQILVVDDDEQLRELLSRFLGQHGFGVAVAPDGVSMLQVTEERVVDLVVLDVMLPGDDGFALLPRLRAAYQGMPVIMLTAVGSETDRVVGLELGADDYLVKPFSPRELLARIKAVLRRSGNRIDTPATEDGDLPPRLRYGFAGWTLDAGRREVRSPQGVLVPLSAGEYDLLMAFVEHPNRVLTRDQLLDLARGPASGSFDRSIDVQISRLRRKLEEDPREPGLIKTVRSGGYMLVATVTRA
jgi:two-component system OmpR family response regulator